MKCITTTLMLLSLLAASTAEGATQFDPTVRFQAEQRYDDDFLLRTGDEGLLTGQFMTKISPQLGLKLRAPTWTTHTWYALDAMYRQTTADSRFDHRGAVSARRQFTPRLGAELEARVFRVSDPTSLPRIGVARTLSPVLYGRAAGSVGYMAGERFLLKPKLLVEGAQVFEDGRVPGFAAAPAVEGWYLQSRRQNFGVEYRFQYFAMGAESSHANSVSGLYRYRISRPMTFTARAGPILYQQHGGAQGVLPQVIFELGREADRFDLGFAVGNDLVGASGFGAALWAQFVSLSAGYRVSEPLRVYGHGSYYRNGPAPGEGLRTLLPSTTGSNGYGAEVGVEYRVNRVVSFSGAFTRIAQVGTEEADLSRNIGAVRLILTNE